MAANCVFPSFSYQIFIQNDFHAGEPGYKYLIRQMYNVQKKYYKRKKRNEKI
jgi:hypothetical protein